MDTVLMIYTTWPDRAAAEAAGRAAVEAGLAACVNILAPMTSIYRWRGAVETVEEAVMLVKTTAAREAAARAFLLARHPYETPAWIALSLDAAHSHAPYLDWVAAETSPTVKS